MLRYHGQVADGNKHRALLRLRRLNEMTAQRDLVDARAEVTAAEDASRRADGRADAAESELADAEKGDRPHTAGRLAARERFLERLRANSERARHRAEVASQALADAETRLRQAQLGLETALRAREAAESQAAALKIRAERQRARREESASNDRWRRPK
jgi:hypothetical protein